MPERRIEYQRVSRKADSGFAVTAPSLERLYIDSALALTDQLVKLDLIDIVEKRTLNASADNRAGLMVKWLSEILGLLEKEKLLCRRIVFSQFDGKRIGATVFGEKHNPVRHGHIPELRAITPERVEMGDGAGDEPLFFARIYL